MLPLFSIVLHVRDMQEKVPNEFCQKKLSIHKQILIFPLQSSSKIKYYLWLAKRKITNWISTSFSNIDLCLQIVYNMHESSLSFIHWSERWTFQKETRPFSIQQSKARYVITFDSEKVGRPWLKIFGHFRLSTTCCYYNTLWFFGDFKTSSWLQQHLPYYRIKMPDWYKNP